jgi:translation initiation factor IF-3
MSHQEIGVKLLQRLVDDTKEIAKSEGSPQLEGRQMLLLLIPVVQK